MFVLGRHLLVELWECSDTLLNDVAHVEACMRQAADLGGATILQTSFHKFSPQGVSGVIVIAESHLSIHTWPEHCYAAIDVFTCGTRVDAWRIHAVLVASLGAKQSHVCEVQRGIPYAEESQ